jgi:hypothetical protein
MPITPSMLSADCFHPNAVGQSIIAGLLWEALPQSWREIAGPN